MCRASKGEKKNFSHYTFSWERLKSEQTVREKVTLTSIPNRSITNSGELCVCACVFVCVWLNENQTSANRRNSGETTDSLSSLFHVIFSFHTPVFYTAIHRKVTVDTETELHGNSTSMHMETRSQDAQKECKSTTLWCPSVPVKIICQSYIKFILYTTSTSDYIYKRLCVGLT